MALVWALVSRTCRGRSALAGSQSSPKARPPPGAFPSKPECLCLKLAPVQTRESASGRNEPCAWPGDVWGLAPGPRGPHEVDTGSQCCKDGKGDLLNYQSPSSLKATDALMEDLDRI